MTSNNNNYLDLSPYKIPGRWYRVFIESDGVDIKVTSADIDGCSYNESEMAIIIPGVRAMDCKIDMHFTAADSLVVTYGYTGEDTKVYVNSPAYFDWANIYIFVCGD